MPKGRWIAYGECKSFDFTSPILDVRFHPNHIVCLRMNDGSMLTVLT